MMDIIQNHHKTQSPILCLTGRQLAGIKTACEREQEPGRQKWMMFIE
jgi:hypothetical protein